MTIPGSDDMKIIARFFLLRGRLKGRSYEQEDILSLSRPAEFLRKYLFGLSALLALQAPFLWTRGDAKAALLGRHSTAYTFLLVLHAGTMIACAGCAAFPPASLIQRWREHREKLRRFLSRGPILGLALASLWVAAFGLLVYVHESRLGKSALFHLLALAVAAWISAGLIFAAHGDARSRARSLAKLSVCLLFGCSAFLLAEIFLRSNPGLLPAAVIFNLPDRGEGLSHLYQYDGKEITVGYRYRPGIQVSDRLMASDANLYMEHAGLVRPVPREEDRILTEDSFAADALGYRNESPLEAEYPIAVSGDSFTSHSVDPGQWPKLLSESLGIPVLNLGLQGYGPHSEVEALIRFGLPRKPRWVILAWYEGNDLIDAQEYAARKDSGARWKDSINGRVGLLKQSLTFHLLCHGLRSLLSSAREDDAASSEYPYPFSVELGRRQVRLGFSQSYLSWLSMPREVVEELRCFEGIIDSLRRLRDECEAQGARLLVAYFPTKEHCYAPLLPCDLLQEKLAGAKRYEISSEGYLLRASAGKRLLAASELLENMDGQRDALVSRLHEEGIEVLDLTPAFQATGARGEKLYWSTDNHWAPAGNELAARIMEDHIRRGGKGSQEVSTAAKGE
jgi:hypothetical protein